jgi:hypothetical protein
MKTGGREESKINKFILPLSPFLLFYLSPQITLF